MNEEQIAEVAHETNRAYCHTIGDDSQMPWDGAPQWQKDSSIRGVKLSIDNPDAPVPAQHEAWLKDKYADGWKYGEVKDSDKKEHPCCVPYEELPIKQRIKDALFVGVVRVLKPLLEVDVATSE